MKNMKKRIIRSLKHKDLNTFKEILKNNKSKNINLTLIIKENIEYFDIRFIDECLIIRYFKEKNLYSNIELLLFKHKETLFLEIYNKMIKIGMVLDSKLLSIKLYDENFEKLAFYVYNKNYFKESDFFSKNNIFIKFSKNQKETLNKIKISCKLYFF